MWQRHYDTLISPLNKLLHNPYIMAVREGFTLTLPIIVAGTLAILVNSLPLPVYQHAMTELFGPGWKLWGQYIYLGTFGVMSVLMALSIGSSLAEDYNDKHPLDRISPSIAAVITLSCLFATMEPTLDGMLISRWLGVHGLLTAILTALIASGLFRAFMHVPLLRMHFYTGGSNFSMSQAMSALLPGLLTVLAFAAYKAGTKALGIDDLNQAIYHWLYTPFHNLGGDHLSTAEIYGFARHALWFMGIHGSNVLEPVMTELYVPAIQINIDAAQAAGVQVLFRSTGNAAVTASFTKPFFDIYTSMGGAGSTLGLLIACLIHHRDQGARKIARISLLPSFFNINEILLFGLPVVLNPVYLIPFILVPLLTTTTTYLAVQSGLVPLTVQDVAWNIPIGINAFLATNSWLGVGMQAFNLALAVLVYSPFVILDDRLKSRQFSTVFKKLTRIAAGGETGYSGPRLLSRSGAVGGLAASLASDMLSALRNNEFHLLFQPQVDSDTGKVYGVESLMRWHHPTVGVIPPPVFIALAEETGYIRNLGLWSLEQSIATMSRWRTAGAEDVVMSVNLSARQLSDRALPGLISDMLKRHNLPVENLKLELTESVALTSETMKNEVLADLHKRDIKLAIDDFGMGHSSLIYLKKFPVSALKLDAVLTRDVPTDRNSCEIILTVVELCRSLKIQIIAEFVEDEIHLMRLRELGCTNIQGYFYSRPLDADTCFAFLGQTHKAYGPLPAGREAASCS